TLVDQPGVPVGRKLRRTLPPPALAPDERPRRGPDALVLLPRLHRTHGRPAARARPRRPPGGLRPPGLARAPRHRAARSGRLAVLLRAPRPCAAARAARAPPRCAPAGHAGPRHGG